MLLWFVSHATRFGRALMCATIRSAVLAIVLFWKVVTSAAYGLAMLRRALE